MYVFGFTFSISIFILTFFSLSLSLSVQLRDEDVDIIKMDATANDVPSAFTVRGFPTLYWKPKSGKPIQYEVR